MKTDEEISAEIKYIIRQAMYDVEDGYKSRWKARSDATKAIMKIIQEVKALHFRRGKLAKIVTTKGARIE